MQNFTHTLLASALLGALMLAGTGSVFAADGTQAADAAPRHEARGHRLAQIDSNHDGKVSRTEYEAWVATRYAEFDPQGKGSVTVEDLMQSPAFQAELRRRAEGIVARHAKAGSREFTRAEFEADAMARFERLADGGDSVSIDELKSRRAERAAHRDRDGKHGRHRGHWRSQDQGNEAAAADERS